MFVNKPFTYLHAHISKSKRCFNVKSSTCCHFHMKTEMLADFQICISVPLTETLFFSLEEGISQVVKVGLSLPKTISVIYFI